MSKGLVIAKKRKWGRKPDTPPVAYSIKIPFGMTLHVKATANAWWMDQQKLHDLIAAFRLASTIELACVAAGITVRQYKYFVQLHPEFNEARRGYVLEPALVAQVTIVKALRTDVGIAYWWLKTKLPEEYGPPSRRRLISNKVKNRQNEMFNSYDAEYYEAEEELTKEYEEKLQKLIIEYAKRKEKLEEE